jgi:FKBP-type peptidyl-prolyl cis-trans isomerase
MKTRTFISIALLVGSASIFSCSNISSKNVELKTQADSASYAIGTDIGNSIKNNLKGAPGGDALNTDIILAAFQDVINDGEVKITEDVARTVVQAYFMKAQTESEDLSKEEEAKFFEENGKKEGMQSTESGIQYEILAEGNGTMPSKEDQVKVHYHGTLLDGTVFDSTVDKGEPATFGVGQVIPGWTEALQLMPTGSKWKVYIPSALAYGPRPMGEKIKANSTLIFEIELLEIVK